MEKSILNFIRKVNRSQVTKTILKNKNKIGGLTLPDFKTYYKVNQSNVI